MALSPVSHIGLGRWSMGKSGDELAAWLAGQGFSENTIGQRVRLYGRLIDRWGTIDVSAAQVAAWLDGYQGWSRRTYHNHVISILDWATETERAASNVARGIKRTPSPRPRPRPLSEADLARALRAAKGRTYAFLMLGYLAGLRAHEIAKFAAEDITRDAIYVYGKGGQGDQLPTHPLLWDLAQRMPQEGLWFPSP